MREQYGAFGNCTSELQVRPRARSVVSVVRGRLTLDPKSCLVPPPSAERHVFFANIFNTLMLHGM